MILSNELKGWEPEKIELLLTHSTHRIAVCIEFILENQFQLELFLIDMIISFYKSQGGRGVLPNRPLGWNHFSIKNRSARDLAEQSVN